MNKLGALVLVLCGMTLYAWPQAQPSAYQETTPPKVDASAAPVDPASPTEDAAAPGQDAKTPEEDGAPEEPPKEAAEAAKADTAAKEAPDYFKAHQKIWDESPGGAETAVAAPVPEKEPGWNTYIPRTIMGLCFVCGIIILGGVLMRKVGRHTPLLAGQRLGVILGKVYLTPKVSLHYVKTGGRVLVVSLHQNQVSLIADFDAGAFESAIESEEAPPEKSPERSTNFLDQLRTQVKKESGVSGRVDDDLDELRGDIQRLQRYLQESARESKER